MYNYHRLFKQINKIKGTLFTSNTKCINTRRYIAGIWFGGCTGQLHMKTCDPISAYVYIIMNINMVLGILSSSIRGNQSR